MTAGLAIYDTMQFIKPDVSTLCIGQACSAGALLLAGGAPNKRYCLPHSRIMIHQPLGGYRGQATDIEIHAQETLKIKKMLNEIYAKHSGKTVAQIVKSMERDNFMSASEAKDFGIVDKIIQSRDAVAK